MKLYLGIIIVFSLLFGCEQSEKKEVIPPSSTFPIQDGRIKNEILNFSNARENIGFDIYQIFLNSNNERVRFSVRATKSLYEILTSPIDTFSIVENKLFLITNSRSIFKKDIKLKSYNKRFKEVNDFIEGHKKELELDISEDMLYVEPKKELQHVFSRTIRFDLYYVTDSLVKEYYTNDLTVKHIKTPTIEKVKFHFNLDSIMKTEK